MPRGSCSGAAAWLWRAGAKRRERTRWASTEPPLCQRARESGAKMWHRGVPVTRGVFGGPRPVAEATQPLWPKFYDVRYLPSGTSVADSGGHGAPQLRPRSFGCWPVLRHAGDPTREGALGRLVSQCLKPLKRCLCGSFTPGKVSDFAGSPNNASLLTGRRDWP